MSDDALQPEPIRPDAIRPDAIDAHPGEPEGADALPGGFDLGSLLGAAQDMSTRMAEAQAAIAATEVDGSAGGGMVKVTLDGAYGIKAVTIDPSVVDPDDVAMLEDLVTAAFRDAVAQLTEVQASADPMAGLDLGALGGLFGS